MHVDRIRELRAYYEALDGVPDWGFGQCVAGVLRRWGHISDPEGALHVDVVGEVAAYLHLDAEQARHMIFKTTLGEFRPGTNRLVVLALFDRLLSEGSTDWDWAFDQVPGSRELRMYD